MSSPFLFFLWIGMLQWINRRNHLLIRSAATLGNFKSVSPITPTDIYVQQPGDLRSRSIRSLTSLKYQTGTDFCIPDLLAEELNLFLKLEGQIFYFVTWGIRRQSFIFSKSSMKVDRRISKLTAIIKGVPRSFGFEN